MKNENYILIRPVLIIFLFFYAISFCIGQNKVVHGNVYAFKNLALNNIQVSSKKAKSSTLTDELGNFTIVCKLKDRLSFVGHGFDKVVKTINNKDSIKVKMFLRDGEKYKNMAIKHKHVSKFDLENSISKYSNYNNIYFGYTDIFEIIQGKFPGVQVLSRGSYKKVVIRGEAKSFTLDNSAIYVVDGIITDDISTISVGDIKSIDIVKDGTIYGVRGANGAVVITTKK